MKEEELDQQKMVLSKRLTGMHSHYEKQQRKYRERRKELEEEFTEVQDQLEERAQLDIEIDFISAIIVTLKY